jgi:hypothetical protein
LAAAVSYANVRDYPDEFLTCNSSRRHVFEVSSADKLTPYSMEVAERCVRCKTLRVTWYDWTWRAQSRRYDHPDGYSIDVDPADLRGELFRREFGVTLRKPRRIAAKGKARSVGGARAK